VRATALAPLGVEEASDRILAAIGALPLERVSLYDALGRVLAEPVVSPVTLPAWTNSGMDGYAVRGADVADASAVAPVRLPVAETVAAGAFPSRALEPGEAMRVMTGAPVPDGADSVVRVEDTDGGVTAVEIRDPRDVGRNLRPRGEDMRAGDEVLAAHTPVGPGQIGLLAACGQSTVSVFRRPRVAIVGSGDELVELDRFHEALAGRRIVSSNGYALHAAVIEAGGVPVDLGIAADTPESLRERLTRAAGCELIVSSAGNSVGAFDHTQDVVASLGGRVEFSRVRMRPGAPLSFGHVAGAPWVGLPGNPVSALVTFELFVRPVIRRMCVHRRLFRATVDVVLVQAVAPGAPPLTHFLRVMVTARTGGLPTARLTGPQGSGLVSSTARADALLVVGEGEAEVPAGRTMRAIPLADVATGGGERLAAWYDR
jgi:molybdopterin molybdotransferase